MIQSTPKLFKLDTSAMPAAHVSGPIERCWHALNARNLRWSMMAAILVLAVAHASAVSGQQTPTPGSTQPPAVNAAGEPILKAPPFKLPDGIILESDLTYAQYGTRELKLDLYRPSSGRGPFPGIVFIHGGAWSLGTKTMLRNQAAYFAGKGYVCVSIEYRLAGEAIWPAALYDSKAAVRWMRANAKKYKIDPNKIAASGDSAGGHLSALLATTADETKMEGNGGNARFSSRVQAAVVFNPATDFFSVLARTKNLRTVTKFTTIFLGGTSDQVPEIYMEASPVAHVSATSAPFLFLHGTADNTLPYQQSLEMQSALQAVGVRAELYSAKDADHGFFNTPAFYQPSLERMEQFLDSVFGKK
jgi:pectinesterase